MTPEESDLSDRARALARRIIIADGHVDLPYRLQSSKSSNGAAIVEASQSSAGGDFDHARAVAGGLDAPFMSIYVPAEYQVEGGAKALADELIDMVEAIAAASPEKFAIPRNPDEIEASFRAGKVSLPLGIENGAAIEGKLENLEHFHRRGVRYITLTHSKDNAICDSSYDTARTWKGLSPFGGKVIEEMNRLGIMVDVSHVSDDAFFQALELSKAPVIASHSSCRHFTPGFERNMSDEMVKALAARGGVVLVNFGSTFLSDASRRHFDRRREAIRAARAEQDLTPDDPRAKALVEAYNREHPPVLATLSDVADHIDHVVALVGVEHVGFGSDFDGVGDTLPRGLEDVSKYPALIEELLRRGYSEEDIEKIASENLFRVWRAVEAHAGAAGPRRSLNAR